MIKYLSAALIGSVLLAPSAFAKTHVFEFTATVDYAATTNFTPGDGSLPEPGAIRGWAPDTVIRVGDAFTGRLVFEDTQAPWAYAGSLSNFAETSLYITSLTMSFPNNGLSTSDTHAQITGYRTDSEHRFTFAGLSDESVLYSGGLSAAATPDQPYAIRFDPAGNNKVGGFFYAYQSQNRNNFQATITSFTEVSPVPEPASYAMLLAGMALVGGAARKRRTASRAHR